MAGRDDGIKGRIADALVTIELVADVAMSSPALPPPVAPQLDNGRRAETSLTSTAPSTSKLVEQAADNLERENERLRGSISSAKDLTPSIVHDPLSRERSRDSSRAPSVPKRSR